MTFIAWYQNVLLLLISLPAAVARRSTEAFRLAGPDGTKPLIGEATACFESVEVAADEQQWRFQRSKRGLARKVKGWRDDYERGFLTHGLFSLSRHPNFWAEQGMWTCFSGFGGEFGIETILHPRLDGGGVVDFTVSGIDRVHREHHRAKVSGLRGVSEDDESIASASCACRCRALAMKDQ